MTINEQMEQTMTKHLSEADLDRLGRGAATLDELRDLGEHLRTCDACAARASRLFTGDVAALTAALTDELPDDVQAHDDLDAYVDGTLSPDRRQAFLVHAERCGDCRAAIDDVERFARAIRIRRIAPAAAALAIAATIAVVFIMMPGRSITPAIPLAPRAIATPALATSSDSAPIAAGRKPEWQALVSETMRTGVLNFPAEVRRYSEADRYRGLSSAMPSVPKKVTPSGIAVIEQQPLFRWPPSPGAHYAVIVAGARGDVIAHSERIVEPEWRCDRVLARDATYRWQVSVKTATTEVILPQPPAPPALFRVVSSAEAKELEDALRARPDDHLLLGLLHARSGVTDIARSELAKVVADDERVLAQRLLAQLP
jgi:anti-sigma factor RsiW